jgi:oxygen-independent coproporphyrinogen-3 oxidase
VALLEQAGYHRYEVSNFCRDGRTSRHNQGYWNGAEYLAFGPGAHSYFDGRRSISPRSFEGYLEWGGAGFPESGCVVESLTAEHRVAEAIMLGLRQSSGLDLEGLRETLGAGIPESALRKWVSLGMARQEAGRFQLVAEGWLVLAEIASDHMAQDSSQDHRDRKR